MTAERRGTNQYARLPAEQVLAHFDATLSEGLSSLKAGERAIAGCNEITASRVHGWDIAIRQFRCDRRDTRERCPVLHGK